MFLYTKTGKERADGLIDTMAMDLHHRIQNKSVPFAIVSNDNGFSNCQVAIAAQGRQIVRAGVVGKGYFEQTLEAIIQNVLDP